VLHHGHGEEDGSRLVVPCNQAEADVIAGFRTGVKGASFDFISSDTSVPYLTTGWSVPRDEGPGPERSRAHRADSAHPG
jgi:hypothetical protein